MPNHERDEAERVETAVARLRQAWQQAGAEAQRLFWRELLAQQGFRGDMVLAMKGQMQDQTHAPVVLLRWGDQVFELESHTAKQYALALLETAMRADAESFQAGWVP
jgi:hypothetical protein